MSIKTTYMGSGRPEANNQYHYVASLRQFATTSYGGPFRSRSYPKLGWTEMLLRATNINMDNLDRLLLETPSPNDVV